MSHQPTYKALFEKYRDTNVLLKSEMYARWTLPQLMAHLVDVRYTTVPIERDYQSFGAQLVHHLGNKLAGLLFPANRPFFRIKVSDELKKLAEDSGITNAELQSNLAQLETRACNQLFLNSTYANLTMLMKHLIVTGNAGIFRDEASHTTLVYGLPSIAVKRDGYGRVLDALVKEVTDFQSLPQHTQLALRASQPWRFQNPDVTIKLEQYTRVQLGVAADGGSMYTVSQECEGLPVGEPGTYTGHLCPWQFPTWSLVLGENYGRGLVEDNAGDFARLSDESHAATLYSIAASKVVNLVSPGSGADVDDLNNAETGEWVQANTNNVLAHEGGDAAKMAQMRESIMALEQRLSRAFMYQANTRDAERVTAYELRQQALEADHALGGVYSTLSSTVQNSQAHLLLLEVDAGMLEGFVTGDVRLDIVSGIPALGRQTDVQNLMAATQDIGAILPILQQADTRFNTQLVVDLILAGHSVDSAVLFKDAATIEEEKEAARVEQQGNAQINQAQQVAANMEQLQQLQQGM